MGNTANKGLRITDQGLEIRFWLSHFPLDSDFLSEIMFSVGLPLIIQ